MRVIDRDLIRGGHYGQRPRVTHTQAEHMGAPTNAANVKKVLANSEPSTHAVSSDNRSSVGLSSGINSGITEDTDAIVYRVEQVTLDSVVTGPIDFVKLDIEGFEHQALLGARKPLATRPTMFVEIHPVELRKYGSSARTV